MLHLSKFVIPGSHLLKVADSSNTLSFLNPDGILVMVVYNPLAVSSDYAVQISGKSLVLPLKAKSVNTVIINL